MAGFFSKFNVSDEFIRRWRFVTSVSDGELLVISKKHKDAIAFLRNNKGLTIDVKKAQYTIIFDAIEEMQKLHQSVLIKGFEIATELNDKVAFEALKALVDELLETSQLEDAKINAELRAILNTKG